MSTVHLYRNGAYWQARWTDERGRLCCKGLGSRAKVSKRAAENLCRKLQAKLELGTLSGEKAPTLAGLCDRYTANHADLAESTQLILHLSIRYLLAWFDPEIRSDRLTAAGAADWRAALCRGEIAEDGKTLKLSESSVCRYVRNVKAIFAEAVNQDILYRNPFAKVKTSAPIPDKTWTYVNDAALLKVMDFCPSTSWRTFLALCRWAGLRQGEAMRLRWDDVELEGRKLIIRNPGRYEDTKHRSREVPIDPKLYPHLEAAWLENSAGLVCPDMPDSKALAKAFLGMCRKAAVQRWPRWCHTLRKCCENDWDQTLPAPAVCYWMGHGPALAAAFYKRPTPAQFAVAAGLEPDDLLESDPKSAQKARKRAGPSQFPSQSEEQKT